MLDVGADHRRRVLRAQRERRAVAVLERVHLLGDDVGLFADAAREQLRLLEDRRADLVVVVACGRPRAPPPRRGSTRPLDGGRMSRVPLTALITAGSSSSRYSWRSGCSAAQFSGSAPSLRRSPGRRTLAGTPITRLSGGISMPSGTSAPAATTEPRPMRAPLSTMAPMPIRQSSSITQPWSTAEWPTVTRLPIDHRVLVQFAVQHAVVLDVGLLADRGCG